MTDDAAAKRWQRVEELFRGAVELPVDERAEFLDAATGDDPELRREVDELLEADSEADDFITGAVRAGEELLTRSAEVLPAQFGKYEVESQLGEGGFGVVYRGRDPMLDRPVAIKACSSTDAGMRKRFYREARIAAGLRHPNITTVHELGVEDGVPFIVQELLEGEDLRQILREERRLPLAAALSYLVQIARGLEHAHGSGVLHRDVKPANVRIQPDGSVKLMDFGIAKMLGADTGLTGTGMTLGTVGYLAPEQLRSEEVDERADIFAFGVLAYELLGQRRPFVGDDFSQVSYQLLYLEPSSLKERWPACPQPLAELVHRCLDKDKLQRPGSMAPVRGLLEDLHRSLEGQPDAWIEAAGANDTSNRSTASGPPSTTRPMKRLASPRGLGWIMVASLAGLALTWGLTRPADDPGPTNEMAVASLEASPPPPLDDPAALPPEEEVGQNGPEQVTIETALDEAPQPVDEERAVVTVPPAATRAGPGGEAPRQSLGASTEQPAVPTPFDPSTDESTDEERPAAPVMDAEDSVDAQEPAVETSSGPTPGPVESPGGPESPVSAQDPESMALALESPAAMGSSATMAPSEDRASSPPMDTEASATEESSPSTMRRGDMITEEGPGVVPPELLQRPQPAYPPRARRRGIEQQVVVKVLVDEDGGVVQVIAPGTDTHGFLAAARNAAREARFEPARRDGVEGRMWVNLNFDFTLD